MWMLRWVGVALLAALAVMMIVAQEFTEQDAIDLALTIPDCRDTIADQEDWYALVYDTGNRYHIWHVEFYNSSDEDMGFADISLRENQIYVGGCYFPASEDHKTAALQPLKDFLSNNERILALVPDMDTRDIYLDYDSYNDWWGVYIDIGDDSLYVIVRFAERTPTSLDDPVLLDIYFSNVKSYSEWFSETSQQAVLIAFRDNRVGDVLANVEGWTTDVEHLGGRAWRIDFVLDEQWLASATVDLDAGAVLDVSVEA